VRNDTILLIAVAALVVFLDQITKSIVSSMLGPHASISSVNLAGDWLQLEYAENPGAAFGLFAANSSYLPLIAIAFVVALLVHYSLGSRPARAETIAIGAITGGAVGNLIDRFRLGHVVDFVAVGPWPNFNVADSAVTVGVLVLIWNWVGRREPRESPRPQ
jgi:signal peptidase II